jgi:hypothetical protein
MKSSVCGSGESFVPTVGVSGDGTGLRLRSAEPKA